MRSGRLIFPVLAELCPFEEALEDPDFKEPVRIQKEADGPGTRAKSTGAPYRLPCQVEPEEYAALNMQANGDAPRTQMHLIFHVRSLRGARPPQVRDRLAGLYTLRGSPLTASEATPELYATEVRPLSYGLNRGASEANLLRVTFRDRSEGVRRLT